MNHNVSAVPNPREGAVLMVVLWVVFLLVILSLGIKAHVDRHIHGALKMGQRVEGAVLARNGVELALWQLGSDTNEWDEDQEPWGRGYFHRFEQGDSLITTTDEAGRLNLNTAHKEWLREVFIEAAGLSGGEASELAAAVLDWRDEDDEEIQRGAESAHYLSNAGYPARNGRLRSPYELKMIRGVSDEKFEALRPYITTYGGGGLNINSADPLVLNALAHSVAGEERRFIKSLISRIERFREDDGIFKSTHWPDMAAELTDEQPLPEGEILILRRMANSITVTSRFFRVVSSGDLGADGIVESTIECIIDRPYRQVVFWHEE